MASIIALMPIPDLNFSTWAGLAAAGALIGTCWRTIASWLQRVADLFICRVVVKGEAGRAVACYVWQNCTRSPFGLRMFGGLSAFVAPKQKVEVVAYESMTSEPVLFFVGRAPLLAGRGMPRGDSTPDVGGYSEDSPPVTLRFLRGTLNSDELIETAVAAYNRVRQCQTDAQKAAKGPRRFNVIRMNGGQGAMMAPNGDRAPRPRVTDDSDLMMQIQRNELRLLTWNQQDLVERTSDKAAFANHPVDPTIIAQLDEIGTWLRNEQWFCARGVPFRRGYLLWGGTGTGKSTIVRNVAIKHDLPLYTFDLSSYDNRGFAEDWKQVQQNGPAIALLEDLDVTFELRKNRAVEGKQREGLTFDCLLNTISGVGSSDGVLLFITTNHIESVDPALGIPQEGQKSSRPGRIDRAIYVGPQSEAIRRQAASIVLDVWPDLIEPTVAAGHGETAAQFQERCTQIALEQFWKRGLPSGTVVDAPPQRDPVEEPLLIPGQLLRAHAITHQ